MHVTTIPVSLGFLRGQPRYMREHGIDEIAVSSPGPLLEEFGRREGVPCLGVAMEREIAPIRDALALFRLWRLLRQVRPDVVDAHTPKGALVGITAAFLARVPVRIYHVHGLRFVTTRGLRRRVLRAAERLTSALATRVLCVSASVARTIIEEGLAPARKVAVILNGSINGVDTDRFHPATTDAAARAAREALGIPAGARVIGFVGRIVREKGVVELLEAWRTLRDEFPDLHLLVLGWREEHDDIPDHAVAVLRDDPRVHAPGTDLDTPRYYRAIDVVALPTYREGFPVVPLEAAASGLPVVATRVPGCTDAIVDGVTGTLIAPRDPSALLAALRRYLRDPALVRRHGAAARERVLREYQPAAIWRALRDEYVRLAVGTRRRRA